MEAESALNAMARKVVFRTCAVHAKVAVIVQSVTAKAWFIAEHGSKAYSKSKHVTLFIIFLIVLVPLFLPQENQSIVASKTTACLQNVNCLTTTLKGV
jgi:hypothetical protein